MSAMSSSAQAELYAGVSSVRPPVEAPALRPADLKKDRFPNDRPSLRKRVSRALSRLLVTFCAGVAATLAWQSYGDAARYIVASLSPQLGWLAPQAEPVAQNAPDMVVPAAPAAPSLDQQQLTAMSLRLDAMQQSVDRIATTQDQMTRSVDRIAPNIDGDHEQITRSINKISASQEQIARSIEQLATGQEQMTRGITKLQEIVQYILYKTSEPSPRPAPSPVRNPVQRPPPAPTVRSRPDGVGGEPP